jgi:hypothetical protein
MDLYSVNSAVAVGNEMSKNLQDINQFRESQNAILIGNASAQIGRDQDQKKTDTEEKIGMDSYTGVEALQTAVNLKGRGALRGGLIAETKANFRSAGNKISNLVSSKPPAPRVVPQTVSDEDFLAESGAAMRGEDTTPVVRPSELAGRSVEEATGTAGQITGEGADAVSTATSGLAKGLSAEKGAFESVAEAGSLSRFMLNKVGGVTSEIGLEVGGKALGGIGGAISAGQDITNLVDTGHIFKKGESGWSEAGNISSMVGAGLDMMSIAVPVLAPLALATNVFSAVAGTIGAEQDDDNQISTDSKPPDKQTLAVHPAWSAVGMTASVHRPTITG